MASLASVRYDPATLVQKSCASLLAMTAIDTTNMRVTFTAPASGIVLVRIKATVTGATTFPRIFLGVLDGATVRLRGTPMGSSLQGLATTLMSQEVVGLVTGLTAGNSYTWDAAYGVDVVVAATNIQYGGPDDASGADAYGNISMEVYDCANLLAGVSYDPTTASTKSTTALKAMTAMDTTNLRLTFTAPTSGAVQWRLHTQFHGSSTMGAYLLGILDGATVRTRKAPIKAAPVGAASTACEPLEASGTITGLTAGNSYTWDAAYAVQVVAGAGGLKHGGPDNATTNDAFGATNFEVWAA